jgi:VanZ family protein
MPSSVSRDDLRGTRTKFRFLRRCIVRVSNRPKVMLLLWAALLVFAGISELIPGDSAPIMAVSALNDKFLHFSVYALIAFVPAFGLRLGTAVACVLTTELVGIALEFAQLFARDRSCDPYDMAANTAGVLVGVILAMIGRSLAFRAPHDLSDE